LKVFSEIFGSRQNHTNIQNIFKEFEVQKITPTPVQLKEAFNSKRKEQQPDTEQEVTETSENLFYVVFDEFEKECGSQNSWGRATYNKFRAIQNHLKNFDNNLSFEKIDDVWLIAYMDYLRTTGGMRNSSIEKQVTYFKWFLRWATKKGYNKNLTFDSFKPKLKNAQKKLSS
jgi:hypothetical protein